LSPRWRSLITLVGPGILLVLGASASGQVPASTTLSYNPMATDGAPALGRMVRIGYTIKSMQFSLPNGGATAARMEVESRLLPSE